MADISRVIRKKHKIPKGLNEKCPVWKKRVLVAGIIIISIFLANQFADSASRIPPPITNLSQTKTTNGSVGNPLWSPDGKNVVFIVWSKGCGNLFVAQSDGRKVKNITPGEEYAVFPVWAPGGKEIYYTSWRNKNADICKTTLDGRNRSCLTKGSHDEALPSVSPDGETIAFCSFKTGVPQLYFMKKNGTAAKVFHEKPSCYAAFSPDGKSVAFVSSHQLIIADLKTGKKKKLTEGMIDAEWVQDSWPVWSPKSNRVAFLAKYESFSSEIYTISPSGKKIRKITDNLFEDFLPAWTPDGKKVVFSSFIPGDEPEIFLADQESPKKERLTQNHDVDMEPSFAPDGAKIVYVRRIRGRDTLYLMDADGKNQRPFFKDSQVLMKEVENMFPKKGE